MKLTEAKPFQFKQFVIQQDRCTMKVGTDGVLLGAWADISGARTILDIGTGSGVIAIMLAQRSANSVIHAVEIDEASFEQASGNMENTPWSDRLSAFHLPIQNFALQHPYHYDLIVSNPPFFSGGTFSHDHNRNNVRHTVKLPHGDLLSAVRTLLANDGKFCIVLPLIEGLRFRELAQSYHLHCTRMTEVRPKAQKPVERLLMQFERQAKPTEVDELIIQREGINEWTEAYVELTGAFYLYM